MTANAIRWPRMVLSRKDGVDITQKCCMKLNERATAIARNTEGEVPPISLEEIRKQLGKDAGE